VGGVRLRRAGMAISVVQLFLQQEIATSLRSSQRRPWELKRSKITLMGHLGSHDSTHIKGAAVCTFDKKLAGFEVILKEGSVSRE